MFDKKLIRHKIKRIQTKLHRIRTGDVCKIHLSCFDDKRYILGGAINSLAYFYKKYEKSIKMKTHNGFLNYYRF